MTAQDVIVIAIAVAAAGVVARFLWRTLNAKSGCGKGCGCASSPADTASTDSRTLKRTPLVTLGQPDRHDPGRPSAPKQG